MDARTRMNFSQYFPANVHARVYVHNLKFKSGSNDG
jgi:hypothetical protein